MTEDEAFQKLQKYFQEKGKDLKISQLFQQDSERFKKFRFGFTRFLINQRILILFVSFSLTVSTPEDGDILVDYSKNRVDEETFNLLLDLVTHTLLLVLILG